MRFRIGAHGFDPQTRQLSAPDAHIATMTPKAAQMLALLIEASPEAVTHERIYAALWPGTFVESGNLHNLAAEIRDAAGDRKFLQTIHKFGYALRDAVTFETVTRFVLIVGDMRIELPDGTTVIGRDQLPFADVSRRHAAITIDGADVSIADLGSKNGTFVGTIAVTSPQRLQDGDEICLGRTKGRVVAIAPGETTATAAPISESRG